MPCALGERGAAGAERDPRLAGASWLLGHGAGVFRPRRRQRRRRRRPAGTDHERPAGDLAALDPDRASARPGSGREREPATGGERRDRLLCGRRELRAVGRVELRQLRDHRLVGRRQALQLVEAVAVWHHHEQLVLPEVEVLLGEELRVGLGLAIEDRDRAEVVAGGDHRELEREALLLRALEHRLDPRLLRGRDLPVVRREEARLRQQEVARRVAVGERRAGTASAATAATRGQTLFSVATASIGQTFSDRAPEQDERDRGATAPSARASSAAARRRPVIRTALSTTTAVNGCPPFGVTLNDSPQWPTITSAGSAAIDAGGGLGEL